MMRLAATLALLLLATPPAHAQETSWRESVRAFAFEHFHNPAWGYSHCQRDYALATALAKTDHVKLDDDVMFAAAYLHDMAAFAPYAKDGIDHADQAAELVDTILKGTGFPEAKLDAVRGAIRTHMYFRDPQGAEARYLHDADALDWLGAIGIARVTALADPNGGKPAGVDVAKMLEDNLVKVPGRVLTPAGRAMMPARREMLARYLRDLRAQTDSLSTL